MCEILRSNFEDLFPIIEAAIFNAEFIGKNSGLTKRRADGSDDGSCMACRPVRRRYAGDRSFLGERLQ